MMEACLSLRTKCIYLYSKTQQVTNIDTICLQQVY